MRAPRPRRAAAWVQAAKFAVGVILTSAVTFHLRACRSNGGRAGSPRQATDGRATPVLPSGDSTIAPAPVVFQGEFRLGGTEPFWAGTIRRATITLRFADEEEERTYTGAQLRVTDTAAVWTAARQADTLVVAMRRAPCDNGMSEERYPFVVTLLGGDVTGCAYPSWTEDARDLRAAPPFDSVRAVIPPADSLVTCHVHARRNVVVRAVEGETGTDMFVRAPGNRRCDAASLPGDYLWLGEGRAREFLGLRGDLLVVDQGMATEARRLVLLDLRTQRQLAAFEYLQIDPERDDVTLRIWRAYALDRPRPGCDAPPGAAGVDSLFTVDLSNAAVRYAGRTRCAVRE